MSARTSTTSRFSRLGAIVLAVVLMVTLSACEMYSSSSLAKDDFAIASGTDYPVIIGKTGETLAVSGAVMLFAAGLNIKSGGTLRFGYRDPAGKSYVLDVPLAKVIFDTSSETAGTAQFTFETREYDAFWRPKPNYVTPQGLIDDGLVQMVVSVTPAQYESLVTQ